MTNNATGITIQNSVENRNDDFQTTGKILFEHYHQKIHDPVIIQGNYEGKEIRMTISQLQGIVSILHDELNDIGIQKGTGIMMVNFPASSEILNTIYFISFVSMGLRVFPVGDTNSDLLQDWILKSNIQYALIPGKELLSHEQHEEDNASLLEMIDVFLNRHITILDTIASFPLDKILQSEAYTSLTGNGGRSQVYQHVMPGDETLIISLTEAKGNGSLKYYTQEEMIKQAIILNLPISILLRPVVVNEP